MELDYLLNYNLRVCGIIFKMDEDNKENRILTVSEGALYSFPGGKLEVHGETKELLDLFLRDNINTISNDLEMNKGKFELHELVDLLEYKRLRELVDADEFKKRLETELYEELGLTTNKESLVHIEKIRPYTVYFEKFYSMNGLLINPVYMIDVSDTNNLVELIENRLNNKIDIRNYIWATARDILNPVYRETFEDSVNYIGGRLKKDGYLNGRNDKKDFN